MSTRKPGPEPRRGEKIELSLDTLEATRKDLAEVTKRYMKGEIGDTPFRAFVYSCNSITKLLHAAKITEIEKRLANLEKSSGRSR